MEFVDITWIVVVVLVASITQTVSGFGFALLAVPLMSLFVDPRLAVIVATLLGAVSSTSQAILDRKHTDWSLAKRLSLSAYLGMPLGILIFLMVSESVLRFFVGVVVLIAVFLLLRGFSLLHSSPVIDWLAGLTSGVLATSTSTNGPPLVFLLQAKGLDASSFRATINTVFTASNIGAIIFFVASGKITQDGMQSVALAFPVMLGGLRIGYWIRPHIHQERFRVLVFVLLVVSACSALSAAVFA